MRVTESRTITLHGVGIDEIYGRIMAALSGPDLDRATERKTRQRR